jgi:hypothetical protein
MQCRFFSYHVTAAALVGVIGLVSMPASAQYGASDPAAEGAKKGTMHSGAAPRTANGKPDLSGIWEPANGGLHLILRKDAEGRPTKILFPAPDADFSKGDAEQRARRAAAPNQPPYKPELLEKVKYLDTHTNEFDGALHCMPLGVPRMGPPQQIVQTPGQVVFLYEGGQSSVNTFRVVPTDGRAHRTDVEPSYLGDSVAHWEGATLVVDVTGFNDLSWIAPDGHFHSEAMHVIERFSRDGDSLKYEVTVEDPNVLTRAWTMNPRQLKLNTDASAAIEEDPPCLDRDAAHLVNSEHH